MIDQITEDTFSTLITQNAKITEFKKGEFIPLFQRNKKEIAIIISGTIALMKSDFNGNLIFIDDFTKGNIISKLWIYNEENDLFLVCKTKVELIFQDYLYFFQSNNYRLITSLVEKFISYSVYLNQKITILQKRNMEDKLMAYFHILERKYNSKKFEIPLTYKDLADYLGVDRSSLMRKLTELEKSKKIKKQGKTIFLRK